MSEPVAYACPFCGIRIPAPAPTHCKKCGNSFRDLVLNEYKENETFSQGLKNVTDATRQQMTAIANRTNWYDEDLVKKKPQTNVKWDNEFATEYQRQNGLSVEDSIQEIEEFNRLMQSEEFDEAAWKAFMDKYNSSKTKRKVQLPVSEMFLEKLSHDRAKKDKDKDKEKKNGNKNVTVTTTTTVGGTFGSANTGSSMASAGDSTTQQKVISIDKQPPPKPFKADANGKGREEFNKYVKKKDNKKVDLW